MHSGHLQHSVKESTPQSEYKKTSPLPGKRDGERCVVETLKAGTAGCVLTTPQIPTVSPSQRDQQSQAVRTSQLLQRPI